jgi:hypothetical protein
VNDTDNPPQGGITSETVGVVHISITAKSSKYRLAKLTRHAVPSVLAGTVVLENISGNLGQAKGFVKLSIDKHTAVGGDLGTVKFQLQTAVKINP